MRNFSVLICSLAALCLAACSSTLPERTAAVPPKVQVYNGTVEQVYAAAQKAFKRVDFTLIHARLGRIEAASSVHSSETFADSRQLVALVEVHESNPGQVEVSLALTQDVASQSFGGTHRTPLAEHSFFGLYFAMLQQVLTEQGIAQPAAKD